MPCTCPTRPTARWCCAPTTGACARSSSPGSCPADPETGAFAGTLADLKQHYAGLSKRYGFAVQPPEGTVNQLGYQLLGRDDVDDAIAIFRYNVELYPDSANVYDSLGEALEQAGRLTGGARQLLPGRRQRRGIGDARLAIFTTNRDGVEEDQL